MFFTLPSFASPSLKSCLHRIPSRSFSFTSNFRYPRTPLRYGLKPELQPSFRQQLAQENVVPSFHNTVKFPSVRNQIIFFLLGSFTVYAFAANQTNVDTIYWNQILKSTGSPLYRVIDPSSEDLARVRHRTMVEKLRAGLTNLRDGIKGWPPVLGDYAAYLYVQIAQPIVDATEGRRVCWAIGVANTLVWLAWRFPRLKPVMDRSFTHSPLSGRSYTMLTSVFSHHSFMHLLFNSMALASFGSAASVYLTTQQRQDPKGLPESTVIYHFLAFFVTAGLFASLTSHVASARLKFPRMVTQMVAELSQKNLPTTAGSLKASSDTVRKAATSILPSLGASGAIYAAVTLTALAYPDSEVSIMFFPMFHLPAQVAIFGLVGLDVLGIIRGWRLFDHWAHLGGAVFGIWYHTYGMKVWNWFRKPYIVLPEWLVKTSK
ncbi:hypothetical protein C8Q75DRAFT_500552 [Abortiporus biennis]|nr:hypothetical protein C8Q75DRAFT_500552 [Abortiporus biennis]